MRKLSPVFPLLFPFFSCWPKVIDKLSTGYRQVIDNLRSFCFFNGFLFYLCFFAILFVKFYF